MEQRRSYSCSFNEPGYYAYCLYAVNNFGDSAVEWKVFKVYDSLPSELTIKSDKADISTGDSITFSYTIKNANEASIGIDKDGERYETIPVADSSGIVTYTFNESGVYCIIIEGSNPYGYVFSDSGIWVEVNEKSIKGDANNDGEVTVADIVTLQKWLLGSSKELTCWQNADLYEDGVIDAFDMVMLRRLLVEKKITK